MLSSTASLLKSSVLHSLRIPVQAALSGSATSAELPQLFIRTFAHYLKKDEVIDRVINVVKHFEKIDPKKVTPASHFEKDLGLDSLDVVEVVMAIEEEFCVEIPDDDADKIFTMEDAINYISQHPQAK